VLLRAASSYRALLADRLDAVLALGDEPGFCRAWCQVSPSLRWDHRPSARRLWQLAKLTWPGTVVELGSYLGNSTIYLAMGAAEVHAIDPHSADSMAQVGVPAPGDTPNASRTHNGDVADAFLANLERFGVRNRVVYHRAPSTEVAATWSGQPVRLLFIDGLHTYSAVRADYLAWQRHLAPRHVVLFDDYLWREVKHAVDDLRAAVAPSFFYVRGGQAMFSTERLPLRVAGMP
jgi:predicted O-methyltransferase YrrM